MKKYNIIAFLLLLTLGLPFAVSADRFYPSAGDLELGKTETLQFVLENTKAYYGFQAEVTLPDGLEAVKGSDGQLDITLSNRADNGSFTVDSNLLPDGTLIMGAFSGNLTSFTGNDGVLVNLKVSVAESFTGGSVEVTNIKFIDSQDKDVKFNSSSAYFGIRVSDIRLDKTEMSLKVGESAQLTAAIMPMNATDKTLTWSSSDSAVATVDADGNVAAKSTGETVITVTCGSLSATCNVTVLTGAPREFRYTYEGQTITYVVIDEKAKTCKTKNGDLSNGAAGNNVEGVLVLPMNPKDGNTTYTLTQIGDYSFKGCEALTSVKIPASVTSIGCNAFEGCKALVSADIPNSVISIGDYAFNGCEALTSITIPNSVTRIGDYTFSGCKSIVSIKIPNSVTEIGANAFANCSSIKLINLPASVTTIGSMAFGDCENLRLFIFHGLNVKFESNIFGNHQPWYIFAPEGLDCTALNRGVRTFDPETTIFMEDGTILTDNGKTLFFVPIDNGMSYAIPEGVTKILAGVFCSMDIEGFPEIHALTIPSTIEEIEADTFNENIKIGRVNFADWSKWYPYVKLGNLYANPYWNSTPYVNGVQMVYPELPQEITEIPDYINYGLKFKGEIKLPRSIKRIGAYAFYNNKELFSVILPVGLEEIGKSAFEGCSLLENPSFDFRLKSIEEGAYAGCTSIKEIVLPEGLTMLGSRESENVKGVFEGCTALEKAVVAVDVDYLAANIFKDCTALDKVYFPLGLKSIGAYAFENCKTLDEITLPATLENIGEGAFKNGSISKLTIPDAVKTIGAYAFANQKITNLKIGKGVELIPEATFINNPLKVVDFSEGLKEIGKDAFKGTAHIGSVALPSTLLTIGEGAFEGNYISSLVIPDDVETLGSGSCGKPSSLTIGSYVNNIAADAFSFEKLYTIRLKAHMPPTLSDAFPLTDELNDQLTLIVNKGRRSTYNVNARWKQIDRILEEGESEVTVYLDGTYRLAEEIRMQSGYMPSVVTKMKVDGPLSDLDLRVIKENMISLTSLDLSDVTNVTALPEGQFAGSLLTDVILPSNLVTIGDGAFSDCRLLQLTELPATVKRIGANAFTDCPGVNIAYLPAALETIGDGAFAGSGMQTVMAAAKLSEIGNGAFSNCTLLEIVDLSETGIKSIPDNSFLGCTELDEVLLPESVEFIGQSAFSGTALRNIDFTSAVETISNGAFSNNRRLVSATLPESLTQVGSNLFSDCPRLISVSMPMSTANVGANVLSGDRKLANLSCAATEVPDAETGAFNDVRYRYVTLTIPTISFFDYLSAPQWGKFENIRNTIQVSVNKGVNVTNASEEEYQEMLKEDELESEQEAAAQENGEVTPARAMRRAAARAKSVQNFATLFDGATLLSGEEGSANRVFITPEPGVNITSILLDGREMLPAYDGYSLLLPEGCTGALKIITDAQEPILGDSNGNGELNIADAVNTANYAVGNKVTNFVAENADVNADGEITLSDASGTVTLLLAQTVNEAKKAPAAIVGHEDGRDALVMDCFDAVASQLNVRLNSRRDYVALQADIVVPEECGIESVTAGPRATGHSLMMRQVGANIYRVVLFDLGNSSFKSGDEALFTLHLTSDTENTDDIVLNNIVAADKAGNEYRLKSTTEIGFSSVEAVDIDYCQPYEIYNLSGMKVGDSKEGLAKGIYVVRQGNAAVKVVVKDKR